MYVDAAARRQRQNGRGKNASIGRDGNDIRRPPSQGVEKGGIFHLEGLEHRNPFPLADNFHGREDHFLPAPLRPIRLSDHTDHLMFRLKQGLQRRHGKVRSPHKYDTHAHALSFCPRECNSPRTFLDSRFTRLLVSGRGVEQPGSSLGS